MPGWWDDDDHEDDPYTAIRPALRTIYGARWDWDKKRWFCICPEFRRRDSCRHTVSFRYTEEIEVKEEYL